MLKQLPIRVSDMPGCAAQLNLLPGLVPSSGWAFAVLAVTAVLVGSPAVAQDVASDASDAQPGERDHWFVLEAGLGGFMNTTGATTRRPGRTSPAVNVQFHAPVHPRFHLLAELATAPGLELFYGECGEFDCAGSFTSAAVVPGVGAQANVGDFRFQAQVNSVNLRPRFGTSLRVAWIPDALGLDLHYTRYVDSLATHHAVFVMGRFSPSRHAAE